MSGQSLRHGLTMPWSFMCDAPMERHTNPPRHDTRSDHRWLRSFITWLRPHNRGNSDSKLWQRSLRVFACALPGFPPANETMTLSHGRPQTAVQNVITLCIQYVIGYKHCKFARSMRTLASITTSSASCSRHNRHGWRCTTYVCCSKKDLLGPNVRCSKYEVRFTV